MHTRTNVPEHVDQPKPRYIGSNILEKHVHGTHALELCYDRCLHRRLSYELCIAMEHLLCVTCTSRSKSVPDSQKELIDSLSCLYLVYITTNENYARFFRNRKWHSHNLLTFAMIE